MIFLLWVCSFPLEPVGSFEGVSLSRCAYEVLFGKRGGTSFSRSYGVFMKTSFLVLFFDILSVLKIPQYSAVAPQTPTTSSPDSPAPERGEAAAQEAAEWEAVQKSIVAGGSPLGVSRDSGSETIGRYEPKVRSNFKESETPNRV